MPELTRSLAVLGPVLGPVLVSVLGPVLGSHVSTGRIAEGEYGR
ncbi:MAG: hypothetical protein ACI89G_003183 [Minisyncoccia bacterium]|jgi:hypothetical protein